MEQLMFSIGLIDKVSVSSTNVSKSLQRVHAAAIKGSALVAAGGVAIGGAGLALTKFTEPANEMGDVFERLSALGIRDAGIKALKKSAEDLARSYSMSAMEIVLSGEYMKNNISRLSQEGVVAFSRNAALLAKAGNEPVEGMKICSMLFR